MVHAYEAAHCTLIGNMISENSKGSIYAEPECLAGGTEPPSPSTTRRQMRRGSILDQEVFITIPPTHKRRTLVLCFDGTGDEFDGDNSNVVNLCSMLKKDDKEKQMVYYQVCRRPRTSAVDFKRLLQVWHRNLFAFASGEYSRNNKNFRGPFS